MTGRALTIKQPHAARIMNGTKVIEFRSWRTSYRGVLHIHAGLSLDPRARPWDGAPLAFGAILGHVNLYDVNGTYPDFQWHLRDPSSWPYRSRVAADSDSGGIKIVASDAY